MKASASLNAPWARLAQNTAVQAGGQAMDFENRYLCKDGSFRWLLWNATPFTPGRVVYSVARDITARKQAEADRQRLVGELEASHFAEDAEGR